MNVIAKLVVILTQCRYAEIAQKYLNTVTYNTTILFWKKVNSLVYKTLSYVNIYWSYKLSKTVRFLAHSVYFTSPKVCCRTTCGILKFEFATNYKHHVRGNANYLVTTVRHTTLSSAFCTHIRAKTLYSSIASTITLWSMTCPTSSKRFFSSSTLCTRD